MLKLTVSLLIEALLIVELALLLLTVYLLFSSMREARERTKLIDQLVKATRTFSRTEYFTEVLESVGEATKYIYAAVTGTSPRDEEKEVIERLLTQYSKAAKIGVKLRFLLPKDPDRLMMGYKYKRAGGEVRYNPALLVSDLRYMVIDGNLVVIGLPERGGLEEPTRKGHKIYSEGVASLFQERFEKVWNSPASIGYEEYLKQTIKEAVKNNPSISNELLSTLLRIPIEEIKRAREGR